MNAEKKLSTCANCGASYLKRADRIRNPDFCSIGCKKAATLQRRNSLNRTCDYCGTRFVPRIYQVKQNQGKYCSKRCSAKVTQPLTLSRKSRQKASETWKRNGNSVPSGPANSQFKGRKISDGYVWVWQEYCGYIAEHRLIAEKMLGRKLNADEVVHHKNEDREDNRPGNLQVMSRAAHMNEHRSQLIASRTSRK